jgi:SagB-type dehydrogenase family enzyme
MSLVMTWTDLGNPVPRDTFGTYVPLDWEPNGRLDYLDRPHDVAWPSLGEAVSARRTARHFGLLEKSQLSAFLWWTCRITAVGDRHLGFPLTQRPAPSAGAIHPIHVCLQIPEHGWQRYDPESHALASLGAREPALSGFREVASQVLAPESGVLMLFVAEPGKTYAKYDFADSLVWRDAGVLFGQMALVAEGLALNFCPLGITGEPWVSRLDDKSKLVGVGAAILGARTIT